MQELRDEENDPFAADEAKLEASNNFHLSKTPSNAFSEFVKHLSGMSEDEQDRLVANTKMGLEEKLEMFTVEEKYTRGSVQVSRGRKMSLLPGKTQHTARHSRVSKIVHDANKRCSQCQKRKTLGKASF